MENTLSLDDQRAELEEYFEPLAPGQLQTIAAAWAAAVGDPGRHVLRQGSAAIYEMKERVDPFVQLAHPATFAMAWFEDMLDWETYSLRNHFRAVVAVTGLAVPKPWQPAWAAGVWEWQTIVKRDRSTMAPPRRFWSLQPGRAARTSGSPELDRSRWGAHEPSPKAEQQGSRGELVLEKQVRTRTQRSGWPVIARSADALELVDLSDNEGRHVVLRRLPPHVAIVPGAPRTTAEINFFVHGSACHACGSTGLARIYPQHDQGQLSGECAQCKTAREFRYQPVPLKPAAPPFRLGADGTTSTVFSPDELRAIAAAELANVATDPTVHATVADYNVARIALVRACTALSELAAMVPDPEAAAARDAAMARYDQYAAAEQHVASRKGAIAPPRGLADRFRQHVAWLERGGVGDGQLVLVDERLIAEKFPPRLVRAELRGVELQRCDLSFADLSGTRCERVTFAGCRLGSTKIVGVHWRDVSLRESRLGLADVVDADVVGGDWRTIAAGRVTWRGTFVGLDLRGADLTDGVFARARFERCDLRGADLGRVDYQLATFGAATGVRFVDCDLRGAKLDGLRLTNVAFDRCKLSGIAGTPSIDAGVTVVDCDLSPDGDGSVGGAEQLLALWKLREGRRA